MGTPASGDFHMVHNVKEKDLRSEFWADAMTFFLTKNLHLISVSSH